MIICFIDAVHLSFPSAGFVFLLTCKSCCSWESSASWLQVPLRRHMNCVVSETSLWEGKRLCSLLGACVLSTGPIVIQTLSNCPVPNRFWDLIFAGMCKNRDYRWTAASLPHFKSEHPLSYLPSAANYWEGNSNLDLIWMLLISFCKCMILAGKICHYFFFLSSNWRIFFNTEICQKLYD